MKAFLVLASVAVALGARCNPPSTFEASGVTDFKDESRRGRGEFFTANDMGVRKYASFLRFPEPHKDFDMWFLADFGAKKEYFEDTKTKQCKERALDRNQESPWGWLEAARFLERRTFNGREVDLYGVRLPHGDELALACFDEDPSTPVGMFEKRQSAEFVWSFEHFIPSVRNTTVFKPLDNCA
eukprot:TRINITY_DN58271_c0_g1_i1.p1 TRINITY_DN58271_c0_g1~~TRINITY_DN58271_c0_g1_i1.p1  ORF type:complete len:184 (+),score=29.19 TRINITY_DN58271_c0_g1_i1:66-617(+)